jgi:alanine racemase
VLPDASPATESWLTIEVDQTRLTENMRIFRGLLDDDCRLMAVVKADAYGHGLLLAAEAFLAGGADLLGVHSLQETVALRRGGFDCPVLVLGPVLGEEALLAARLGAEITLPSLDAARQLAQVADRFDRTLPVHLKVETGVNRQGVTEDEVQEVVALLNGIPSLHLVGLSSHFADIEDTTDHSFARQQMQRFQDYQERLAGLGHPQLLRHMTCSAATLLWERTHWGMARVGISAYGLWPSRETLLSVRQKNRPEVRLQPAVTWKVRVSQVRQVRSGETVGYGRSWKAMADSRIAVLPVGYSDGIPRALSGRSHVLLRGKRAPLVGRICMNLCMVDVTHIPEVQAGDQAVLLGRQGDEVITAEQLAEQLGTISYEVLTLPGPSWRRVAV